MQPTTTFDYIEFDEFNRATLPEQIPVKVQKSVDEMNESIAVGSKVFLTFSIFIHIFLQEMPEYSYNIKFWWPIPFLWFLGRTN